MLSTGHVARDGRRVELTQITPTSAGKHSSIR